MKFAQSIPASIGAAAILALAPMTAMAAPNVQTKEAVTTTQTTTTQAKPQKFNIDENSDLESQQAAKAAGASDYLLEAGRAYNAFTESSSEEGFKIPVHGNYCGPGHSGPGAPIDKLDELCQTHDNCYGKKGYFSCSCDAELREGIIKNWGNFNGAGEKANAAAIFAAFSKVGCNPF